MKNVTSLFLASISFSIIIPTSTVIAEESHVSKDDYDNSVTDNVCGFSGY